MKKHKKKFEFKLGDKTKDVWIGDFVTTCEFITNIGQGRMLFYDTKFKCFRRVFIEMYHGEPVLNGWEASHKPSELL